MPRALKVYRTPIGFHDAYVAAPTQKAALEAWGTDANLFARGLVEVVTDPKLTEEPLANPGKVIKRLRGTAEEHFDALPKSGPQPAGTARPGKEPVAKRKLKPKKLAPRPSRAKLDAAEQGLAVAEAAHRDAEADLRRREDDLRSERRSLEKGHAAEVAKLQAMIDRARDAYDAVIARWREDT